MVHRAEESGCSPGFVFHPLGPTSIPQMDIGHVPCITHVQPLILGVCPFGIQLALRLKRHPTHEVHCAKTASSPSRVAPAGGTGLAGGAGDCPGGVAEAARLRQPNAAPGAKPMGNPWETQREPIGNPWEMGNRYETHGERIGNPAEPTKPARSPSETCPCWGALRKGRAQRGVSSFGDTRPFGFSKPRGNQLGPPVERLE